MFIFSPTLKKSLLILFSFIVGAILTFLQLPTWLDWLRPLWLVLILWYWVLRMPRLVNLGIAFLVGFFLDIVYNIPLGEHALALIIVVYFITEFREEIMSFSFWKMIVVIFGLMMIYQLAVSLIQVYLGSYVNFWDILSYSTISALVWPLLAWLLFNYQLKFRI